MHEDVPSTSRHTAAGLPPGKGSSQAGESILLVFLSFLIYSLIVNATVAEGQSTFGPFSLKHGFFERYIRSQKTLGRESVFAYCESEMGSLAQSLLGLST